MSDDQKWLDEDYEEAVNDAKDNYEDYPKEFDKESFGSHELLDRAFLIYENWEHYVLSHPTTCIDKNLYEAAWRINQAMADFYQLAGSWDYISKNETGEKE